MDLTPYRYRLTLTEPLLGSQPRNREVYTAYIAARAAAAANPAAHPAEVAGEANDVQEVESRGWTGFLADEQGVYILDYVLRGYLKAASRVLGLTLPGKRKAEVALGPSVVDNYVFVTPRKLRLLRAGQPIRGPEGVLERPLRAMTVQGPRVSLARSYVIREDATIECEISLLGSRVTADLVEQLLDYGRLQGLGQWRNASYGRFTWERT